jgi:CDGSH-type Zn-finger protein/uncharacterized Fe-S cluster protein YjdI
MCTYLYAAFSLKSGTDEGLTADAAAAVARWRRVILDVAIEEMGHLAAVWNITAALGGAPRFGRGNFPLDPGYLPAGVVVKLAPFSADVLQHFIHLERPHGADEPDGAGFAPERMFVRGAPGARLTPMGVDYDTVGDFYAAIGHDLRALVAQAGEAAAFCGDPALQLSAAELSLPGVAPVRCLKTALAAFDSIVTQGEGAPAHSEISHFQKFAAIRTEFAALRAHDGTFAPAHPAAHNPVLRRPPRPENRVWIEDADAVRTVDLANACYQLMLRLLAYAYTLPGPSLEKTFAVDAAVGLMQAMTLLGERAARLPAGPAHAGCNAGISFTSLRDTAALPPGPAARRFIIERFAELAAGAAALGAPADPRAGRAATLITAWSSRASSRLSDPAVTAPRPSHPPAASAADPSPPAPPAAATEIAAASGVEVVQGEHLTLLFDGHRCIHSRLCVTGAPTVFLANVQGPWIHPDAIHVESLVAIAHACPSGAIKYTRKDGRPDEAAPPVNLAAIREAGPYAFRGDLRIDDAPAGFRATLCRCGASRNKPYCDGSHHAIDFQASGEPKSGATDALARRDGPLRIDPQPDGPLAVRGNLEITSGTGRIVARVEQARLCRCGASATKPFCDGSHARIGFRSGGPPPPS